MPFVRPDLQTLIERAQADIQSRLPGTQPQLRRSLTGVIARMEAGVAHGLYGYLDWLALQLMPDTAETEHLERWAEIWGVSRKEEGYATGQIRITGTDGFGLVEGAVFQRFDGAQYVSTAEVLLKDGEALVPVRAVEAGTDGNCAAGTSFSLLAPVTGVQSSATTLDGLTGGVDRENDESLRARLLSFIRRTPMGGAAHDYETWALEVPGVTRAFVSPLEMGPGTVTVRFMMDDTYENGIPTEKDRQTVQAYIEEKRPVTADVFVVLPIPDTLKLRVTITPDTAAVRRAAEDSVSAAIKRDAVPGGVIFISRLDEALSLAAGEMDHVMHYPVNNVLPENGHIIIPGGVEWVDA